MSPPPGRRSAVLLATVATAVPLLAPAPAVAAPPAPAAVVRAGGPATPTALWASTTGTGISLAWEQPRAGSPAVSFRVYESAEVVARASTTSAYLEVPFGSSHTYTVAAVDRWGQESPRSAAVTGRSWLSGVNPECLPDPGVSVTVTEVTASAVGLTWTRHPLGADLEVRVDGSSLGWTSATGVRVGGLTPGAVHQVALYRQNRCQPGGLVLVGSRTVTTAPGAPARPAAPTGLAVTGRTDSTVDLTWSAPTGPPPARYAVYDGATLVATTTGTATRVDRLYHATRHRFTVAALDAVGNESAHAPAVTTATATCLAAPPRPATPTVLSASPSSVRLAWTLDAAADAYTVLDGETPVATTRYPEVALTGLRSASSHAYRVVAALAQGCGESPRGPSVDVSTPGGPTARPPAPGSLVVSGNVPDGTTTTQVTLSWSAGPAGEPVVGYRVYEGADVVGGSAGTSLTLPVGAATTHEYVVVAVNAAGHESAPSPRVTVRATFLPPP
ncbi:hypothetical protein O7606_03700 [Micromonospora sp. WMMD882]|uniref:hypothetical protein n=1 Tax=Micromonospora sp. WMMD882 TaxID=3015151 RepID=UPI00248A9A40|nr:hypothetical protein [Micromonospora sp. WMMD882]WBB80501.1 hypothetical protein O7606_03700 [Micromonospora sp. WMMD882]